MEQDLKGHRAVITGASSGLGEEYSRQLAARGVDLVIAARRVDRLQKLAAELIAKYAVKIEVLQLDLVGPGAAVQLFQAATAQSRKVTMLINNAGIGPFARFLDEKPEKHLNTMQLNTVALTELCHHFATHMVGHGSRSYITNVGSIASFQGVPNFAVYSATKFYVRVLSEILARELKRTKVSVTCLCPGGTHTEFSDANGQVLKEAATSMMMSASVVVALGIRGMLAGRTIVVPGFLNKLACFFPRLVPNGLALTLAQVAMDRSATPVQRQLK
ncbi:MAG: SDR family NAD(P)-dependent oxidoreductase [Deltaproteobacteria bacterium]|nr:SDR family NAD(P)-dependent oxidoreductase [Deltaproteobacteria bacterium]